MTMAWTAWRLLAERSKWFDESFDYNGAACYELSIGGPRGGDRRIVYCGHTGNEKQRMSRYGRDGSHLAKIIQRHLRDGWSLSYRGWCCDSKESADAMERRQLQKFDFPWNLILNQR
jgi:hypothetical protein